MNPLSPCTGSNTMRGHVLGRDVRLEGVLESVEVVEGNAVVSGANGPRPALYGCVFDVRLSASSVRPWKPPSKPITPWRPV